MLRAVLTVTLGFSLAGIGAARDIQMPEGAYEVALGAVALPSSTAGSATFKPCAECDTVALPVTSATRYFLSGRELALPDFLLEIDPLRRAQRDGDADVLTVVHYDQETKQVTRIAVFPPRA
jgi:hypothetical protein